MVMNDFMDKKMPRAILCTLLIMIPLFSVDNQLKLWELYILVMIYVVIQYFRDFVMQVNLYSRKGLFFLIGQLILLSVIMTIDQSFISQVYLLILIGEMVFHQSLYYSIPFALTSYVAFVTGKWIAFDFPPISTMSFIIPRITEFLVIMAFSYLVKVSISQKQQLENAYEKMKTTSLKLEEKIIIQERKRFAREMHDSIGHSFSTSLIGLNAVQKLIEKEPKEAMKLLKHIHENLEIGLYRVRKSVRELQDSHFFVDFQNAVEALLEETIQQTDVKIDVKINVEEKWMNSLQEIVVYRALQEGLTNGLRHGEATMFVFRLFIVGNSLVFYLSDNGKGFKSSDSTLGFGLIAMKERVKELNGKLTLHSNKSYLGGVDIIIELPRMDSNFNKVQSIG
ncbi:sensor histidine kinase [Gracilibacillus saliphilus]|uniref:sensor histidine kinase n=1 Tax=Gracilibacillus saliphilus TaxID=543890 RepID=UPI0013D396CC|nr:sensor histidine kinase [Gracilibacillus saliphilus]